VNTSVGIAARERWMYAGLAALLLLVGFTALAQRPLFNPDEGRYAEIPREMLRGGDWVIPHLNGLAYIEKPPLQYWATALSFALFGENALAARLYMALSALGTVAVVWFMARRIGGEQSGWRAAAILSGMVMFLALSQLLTLDMSLTFYMTLSVAGFLSAQQAPPRSSGRWMLLAWFAAALGVLTKGLIAAAIPCAVLILYSLFTRDFAPWRRLYVAWGLPLFLGLTVPWHWLAALRLNDFLQFFFVHEHLARYLTPISERQEPWWFFGWVFLAATVPWTLSALRVAGSGWRERALGPNQFNPLFFLWVWVIFVVVFFSLSDSKLMPYILPAMPILAVLIAVLPEATLKRDFRFAAVLTAVAGLCLLIASFNWPAVISSSDRSASFLPLGSPLREVAAVLLVSGICVSLLVGRAVTRAAVFLGVGWCLAGLLVVRTAALVAPIYSGVALAAALPAADRDAPFYSVGTYDQSFTFYLGRSQTLVRYRGELDYGLNKSPNAGIADMDEFLKRWASQTRAFAVMDKETFNRLKERGVPMRIVGQNLNQVLVARS
jgi:4-amino-4-deoxy-L-arabinose transferase-like glycosyltransferase